MQYRVLHKFAGEHPKGTILEAEQITDLPFWLRAKAVEPVAPPQVENPFTEGEIKTRLEDGSPILIADLHHMKAKSMGLVRSEDGKFWVTPAELNQSP